MCVKQWVGALAVIAALGAHAAETAKQPDAKASDPAAGTAQPDVKKPSTDASCPASGAFDGNAPKVSVASVRVLVRGEDAVGQRNDAPTTTPSVGQGRVPSKLVVSGSDLEIAVDAQAYESAAAFAAKCRADLKLFINGIDASPAATLFARVKADKQMLLRYHVAGGTAAQTLWKPLYRQNGLAHEARLELAFGWLSTGPSGDYWRAGDDDAGIAVAPVMRRAWATILVVGLIILAGFAAALTDVFRDPAPPWMVLYRQSIKVYSVGTPPVQAALLLTLNPAYLPGTPVAARCELLGLAAAAGNPILPADEKDAVIGLLVLGKPAPMPTLSLSRLQMGLWFLFAVFTGLFLWIVYGELVAITGSLLGILAISVGTAGVSLAAQPTMDGSATKASRGLMNDVVTGPDEREQLHRYQAVIANLLLLGVGCYYVFTELGFPVYDETWLVFLGVSGATLAGGKKMLEK